MADIFQINNKDLKKLIKFYKRAPRQFTQAAAGVINHLAFTNRRENIIQIKKSMTVRNQKFVESALRVKPAKGNKLSSLIATEGSVAKKRFTGWAEQELNKPAKRKRLQTIHARGGSFKKKVTPRAKMQHGKKLYTYKNFQKKALKTKGQATVAMLVSVRMGMVSKKPAIIESGLPGKLGRFKYGMYIIQKRSIKKVQNLNPRNVQPKRNKWMSKSIKNLSKVNLHNVWEKSIRIVLKRNSL